MNRHAMLNKYLDMLPPGAVCMETGRARSARETHGHSTRIIAEHPNVAVLISIDKNAATENFCKELLSAEALAKVTFINGDSLGVLKEFVRAANVGEGSCPGMDFVYFDSSSDPVHTVRETTIVVNELIREGGILMWDDTDIHRCRKGRCIVPIIEGIGVCWAKLLERVEGSPKERYKGTMVVRVEGLRDRYDLLGWPESCQPMHCEPSECLICYKKK